MFLKKVKAGYTLIETICAVSILIIVASLGISAVKGYNGLKNQIECRYVETQILNFFNNSRDYCKNRNLEGGIFIDPSLNRFTFYEGFDKCIDRFYFPKDFKVQPINSKRSHGEIRIDKNGKVLTSCKIEYINLKKERKTNTIYVGTGYVRIE